MVDLKMPNRTCRPAANANGLLAVSWGRLGDDLDGGRKVRDLEQSRNQALGVHQYELPAGRARLLAESDQDIDPGRVAEAELGEIDLDPAERLELVDHFRHSALHRRATRDVELTAKRDHDRVALIASLLHQHLEIFRHRRSSPPPSMVTAGGSTRNASNASVSSGNRRDRPISPPPAPAALSHPRALRAVRTLPSRRLRPLRA